MRKDKENIILHNEPLFYTGLFSILGLIYFIYSIINLGEDNILMIVSFIGFLLFGAISYFVWKKRVYNHKNSLRREIKLAKNKKMSQKKLKFYKILINTIWISLIITVMFFSIFFFSQDEIVSLIAFISAFIFAITFLIFYVYMFFSMIKRGKMGWLFFSIIFAIVPLFYYSESLKPSLKKYVEMKGETKWACNKCMKTFKTEKEAKNHLSGCDFDWECEKCRKPFRTKKETLSHESRCKK